MKRFLAVTLAALLAMPALVYPQADAMRVVRVTLLANYDLTSASYIYCNSLGLGALPESERGLPGPARIKNGAATTDLTTFTASANPFTSVAVGDIIQVSLNGRLEERVVVTRTDANNIVVEKALDLNDTVGHDFWWRDVTCGTGAEDGWVRVERFDRFQFFVQVSQINATSIDARVECQVEGPNQLADNVYTQNYTAATSDALAVPGVATATGIFYDRCRVGLKINTDAGVQKIELFFHGAI